MKHTIKLLTLAAILTAVFGLTGCPGPVNNYIEPEYTITVKNAENGVVETDKTLAKVGETVTLTITPNSSYELENITVNDVALSGEGNTRTFTMPAEDVVINVTFKEVVEDNTTVDDGNSEDETTEEPEQTIPEDTTDDTTTEDTEEESTDVENGESEEDIQYDAAGGYDGELPDGVDYIKHFQYEDGYKIELNVCTSEEYDNAGDDKTTVSFSKKYISFPNNIEILKTILGRDNIVIDEEEGLILSFGEIFKQKLKYSKITFVSNDNHETIQKTENDEAYYCTTQVTILYIVTTN